MEQQTQPHTKKTKNKPAISFIFLFTKYWEIPQIPTWVWRATSERTFPNIQIFCPRDKPSINLRRPLTFASPLFWPLRKVTRWAVWTLNWSVPSPKFLVVPFCRGSLRKMVLPGSTNVGHRPPSQLFTLHITPSLAFAVRRLRQQQNCIYSNSCKRPCYGSLKLKPRHSNIYYNVVSLLLCFRCPPMTMDTVLAAIIAGGQSIIN